MAAPGSSMAERFELKAKGQGLKVSTYKGVAGPGFRPAKGG